MALTWQMFAIICPLCFLAGFVDSVAGGGGLISLPAYYLAGLSPVVAAGTNKLSACIGTVAASGRFLAGHRVDVRVALLAALGAFPGSWLGAVLLQTIPEQTVRVMMIAAIPLVAAVVLRRKKDMVGKVLAPGRWRLPAAFGIGLLVGFYAPRSHRVIEERNCRLQPECFKTVLDCVVRWAKKAGVSAYDEESGRGLLRHIYIRRAEATGEVMVCLVCTSGKLPEPQRLVELLRGGVPGLASVVVNLQKEATNVILGEEGYTLWGKDFITDRLCGLTFRLSPRSFYQVNRSQAERLYALAAEAAGLTGRETVLDLYCGTGTIGLSMASKAGRIIGVELIAAAVEDARRNAEDNGIDNARFICGDAAEAAVQLEREGIRPDVAVIDPPRKGCSAALIDTLVRMNPSRLVYVSCDPATLARDLKALTGKGYAVERVTPVDMFPRTPHVECVALLTKPNTNR